MSSCRWETGHLTIEVQCHGLRGCVNPFADGEVRGFGLCVVSRVMYSAHRHWIHWTPTWTPRYGGLEAPLDRSERRSTYNYFDVSAFVLRRGPQCSSEGTGVLCPSSAALLDMACYIGCSAGSKPLYAPWFRLYCSSFMTIVGVPCFPLRSWRCWLFPCRCAPR